MRTRIRALSTLLALLACGVLPSCAIRYVSVPRGFVATRGVRIVGPGIDLASGADFRPPFETQCDRTFFRDLVTSSADFEEVGARRVRVIFADDTTDYYGVLALCRVVDGVNEPATRSYSIRIPEERRQAARGGRVTVMYETYGDNPNRTLFGWILWLSDRPF